MTNPIVYRLWHIARVIVQWRWMSLQWTFEGRLDRTWIVLGSVSVASHLKVLVLLTKIPQVARGEKFCDEIDAPSLIVMPSLVTSDNVGMIQLKTLCQFCHNGLHLLIHQSVCILYQANTSKYSRDARQKGWKSMAVVPRVYLALRTPP